MCRCGRELHQMRLRRLQPQVLVCPKPIDDRNHGTKQGTVGFSQQKKGVLPPYLGEDWEGDMTIDHQYDCLSSPIWDIWYPRINQYLQSFLRGWQSLGQLWMGSSVLQSLTINWISCKPAINVWCIEAWP